MPTFKDGQLLQYLLRKKLHVIQHINYLKLKDQL